MNFKVGSRVQLTRKLAAPKGYCGKVLQRYNNGNYRVRITHKPDCTPLEPALTLVTVDPNDLAPCNCA